MTTGRRSRTSKKNGGVCPNGVTRMLSHGAKKPVRLVEIKHRGVDAPCPAP